jgi:uroporphyrinogen-III synthase
MGAKLRGQVILNTRPAHQQAELTALLEREGARVLSFPVIEIIPSAGASDSPDITQYDILLFVSRNAVDGAFERFDAAQLTAVEQLGVIGTATRAALVEHIGAARTTLIASEPYNSEALLAADALQRVAGRRVLILRGQAGRNLLGDELARRGAQVDYCEVYRRALPAAGGADFERVVSAGFPTLVILTSNEGMHNLFALVDAASARKLRLVPWLLISERMRESALKLGHNAPVIIARSASDQGIQRTICDWAN